MRLRSGRHLFRGFRWENWRQAEGQAQSYKQPQVGTIPNVTWFTHTGTRTKCSSLANTVCGEPTESHWAALSPSSAASGKTLVCPFVQPRRKHTRHTGRRGTALRSDTPDKDGSCYDEQKSSSSSPPLTPSYLAVVPNISALRLQRHLEIIESE